MEPTIKLKFLDEHAAEGAARFGIHPQDLTFIGGKVDWKFDSTYCIARYRVLLLHQMEVVVFCSLLSGIAASRNWHVKFIRFLQAKKASC